MTVVLGGLFSIPATAADGGCMDETTAPFGTEGTDDPFDPLGGDPPIHVSTDSSSPGFDVVLPIRHGSYPRTKVWVSLCTTDDNDAMSCFESRVRDARSNALEFRDLLMELEACAAR
jgi:hypothetical protein